jgi:Ca-activated chloride channel family protein
MKLLRWAVLVGSWAFLSSCATTGLGPTKPLSFEEADRQLRQDLLPKIEHTVTPIPDELAARYATDRLQEVLPDPNSFALYGAQPGEVPNAVYLEIYSSAEKANGDRQNERWLVEVADAFNRSNPRAASGAPIRVGVRNVPSGMAVQLIAAGRAKPQGYTPSNQLWVELLRAKGVQAIPIVQRLVPNTAGFVVQPQTYAELAKSGSVTFDRLLDAIAAGRMQIGYPNPYTSATALNLLYTLFWRAAGHQGQQPLTKADLQQPQVSSVFEDFQRQVLITMPTTLALQEVFIRDPQKLQAIPLEYQNYQNLKKLPGFEKTMFIPFGVPHDNPLVSFAWAKGGQREALRQFSDFALSPPMQRLAQQQGFTVTDYLKDKQWPPVPSGSVLQEVQSFWKQKKDSGRNVYLMAVIDTSGSMEGEPLQAVKEGLRSATAAINAGNNVGLLSFSDRPQTLVPLAPFDTRQQQRLLAAIDALKADGKTALYDAMAVGLADLMVQRQRDPQGRFYLLVLTDGRANLGLDLARLKPILEASDVRVYPIAYGDVDRDQLANIAALRESSVLTGSPQSVRELLKSLFQANL